MKVKLPWYFSIWITLAMQSKDSIAKVNILDLYVYTTAFPVLIVFMPSVCFQLKSIFDSMTGWNHFVTLFICLKISVFTPILILLTFSFSFYFLFFLFFLFWDSQYHKLLSLAFFTSHVMDFQFSSLDCIVY